MVLVWRLDRWGISVADLLATLQELEHLDVGSVSLTEALDLTSPAGRAMAALLAVFAEFEREVLRERVRAGLAHARQNGKRLGRPLTAALHADQVPAGLRSGEHWPRHTKPASGRRLNRTYAGHSRRKRLNNPLGDDGLIARRPCRSGTTGSSSILP